MHRIDTEGHLDGQWQDGNPQVGQQGTIMSADWLNDVQGNICTVIEDAGIPLEKGNLEQLKLAIAAMVASASAGARVRPGIVDIYAGDEAPVGYLECAGQAVSRATYAELFAAIGTVHGVGNGATTFNLPDLRGEFVRGWDNGRGIDDGRAFGSAQADLVKQHTHSIATSGVDPDGPVIANASAPTSTSGSTGNMTAGGGTETRPRNVALMYVIKT